MLVLGPLKELLNHFLVEIYPQKGLKELGHRTEKGGEISKSVKPYPI